MRALIPLAFCRECGQEYYPVRTDRDQDSSVVRSTKSDDTTGDEESEAGFLFFRSNEPWPAKSRPPEEFSRAFPTTGTRNTAEPSFRVRTSASTSRGTHGRPRRRGGRRRSALPLVSGALPLLPLLRRLLRSGPAARTSGSCAPLGSEGRSSRRPFLSLSAIVGHCEEGAVPQARPRSSCPSPTTARTPPCRPGHFNDFVEVGLLRSALYRAVERGRGGRPSRTTSSTQKVFEALDLPFELYASDPDVAFAGAERHRADAARRPRLPLYRDLERGWRITAPNLEQCGLLEIDYDVLDEVCAAEDVWEDSTRRSRRRTPSDAREGRARSCSTTCAASSRSRSTTSTRTSRRSSPAARASASSTPWAIDEDEPARVRTPCSSRGPAAAAREYRRRRYLSARGGFGQYLRRPTPSPATRTARRSTTREQIILDLLEALTQWRAGRAVVDEPTDDGRRARLPAAGLGDALDRGRRHARLPRPDARARALPTAGRAPTRSSSTSTAGSPPTVQGLEAREHTAQVPYEEREEREKRFREAELPVLFCSPTMELGVDIAELNAVNLRNVPPTPANYAQRSGRAGRSGQPALVFTYCSTGSPHDQYFFRRPS